MYFPLAGIFQTKYVFSFSISVFPSDHFVSVSIHVFKLGIVFPIIRMCFITQILSGTSFSERNLREHK